MNKIFFSVLTFGLLSASLCFAVAQENLNYCDLYLRAMRRGNVGSSTTDLPYYNEYWSVDSSGKLVVDETGIKAHDRATYTKKEGVTEILANPMIGSKYKVFIKTDKDGKLVSIKIPKDVDKPNVNFAEHFFKTKNGICYPDKAQVTDSGLYMGSEQVSKPSTTTVLSKDFCGELNTYLNKHPEAYDCACGTEENRKALNGLFEKHNVRGRDFVLPIIVGEEAKYDDVKKARPYISSKTGEQIGQGIIIPSILKNEDCMKSKFFFVNQDPRLKSAAQEESVKDESSNNAK